MFGGTGAGFVANPVIGDNGSIIGVDILSVGSGYQPNENVYAQIVDACGRGGGSVITPFLGTLPFGTPGVGDGLGTGGPGVGIGGGAGIRGVLDPYWANLPKCRQWWWERPSITNPIFVGIMTFGFNGLITGERLDLPDREPLGVSPAVGITTESTSDTPLPSPFIPSSVLTPDWKDNTWPGIITVEESLLLLSLQDLVVSVVEMSVLLTFPPGFFDPTGPGLTPAVNYYVNYSEIVSTGATTDSQFDDEIGQQLLV